MKRIGNIALSIITAWVAGALVASAGHALLDRPSVYAVPAASLMVAWAIVTALVSANCALAAYRSDNRRTVGC